MRIRILVIAVVAAFGVSLSSAKPPKGHGHHHKKQLVQTVSMGKPEIDYSKIPRVAGCPQPDESDSTIRLWSNPGASPYARGPKGARKARKDMPRLLRDIACWPKEVVDSVAIKMQQPGDSAWHANGYRYDLVWSDHGVVMRNGIIMFHILRKGLGATPDFRRSEEWHIDFEGKRYMWGVHTVCNNPVTLITLIPEIICPVCIIPPPEPKKEKCYEFYFPGTPGHSMVLNTYTRNGESFPATVCDGIRQGTGDVVKQPDCFDCVVGRDSVPSNWKPIYRRSYTMTNREQTLILPTSEVYVTFCEENASGIAVTRGYVLHRREWVISETERSFMALTEDKRYHVSARPGFNTPDDRGWDPTTTSGLPEEP